MKKTTLPPVPRPSLSLSLPRLPWPGIGQTGLTVLLALASVAV